jgi:hypothetical protein
MGLYNVVRFLELTIIVSQIPSVHGTYGEGQGIGMRFSARRWEVDLKIVCRYTIILY